MKPYMPANILWGSKRAVGRLHQDGVVSVRLAGWTSNYVDPVTLEIRPLVVKLYDVIPNFCHLCARINWTSSEAASECEGCRCGSNLQPKPGR